MSYNIILCYKQQTNFLAIKTKPKLKRLLLPARPHFLFLYIYDKDLQFYINLFITTNIT